MIPVKIGACGSGKTGKTTALKGLDDALGIPFLPSVARPVLSKYDVTDVDQFKMQPEQMVRMQKEMIWKRIEVEQRCASFISDRTLMDHYAYVLYYCGRMMEAPDWKLLEETVAENVRTYDLIFFFPILNFNPPSGGEISDDYSYRTTIDLLIRGIIDKMELPVLRVPALGLEGTAEFVKMHAKAVLRAARDPYGMSVARQADRELSKE